jgi:hypothetical protein
MVLNLLFSIIIVAATSQNANDLTTQSPSMGKKSQCKNLIFTLLS